MSSNPLQIALEHHRAGRLRQAHTAYRALLDADPHNPEALHWFGVLAFQAGRPGEAIPLLERAIKLQPTDVAYWHNLAHAYAAANRKDDAVAAFERAADLDPRRAETFLALGLAHLERAKPGDAESAVVRFRQANAAGLDTPQLHHHLGVALLLTTMYDDAAHHLLTALEKRPDYASAFYYLGLAQHFKGDAKATRKSLNKALELNPDLARAWQALATLDLQAGNADIAAALFRKAIKARPDFAAAHQGLGRALQRAGRQPEALKAFAQAVRMTRPRDADRPPGPLAGAVARLEDKVAGPRAVELHHALAANAEIFSPTHVPLGAIEKLFDRYADKFDTHLRDTLRYQAPELIAEAAATALPSAADQPVDVYDLGCGTGLCGPLLRPLARTLAGIDLSAAMVDKARARNVYDRLDTGDLVAALRDGPPATWDLLTAADVLIYIGDLSPFFEAAARALRPGGRIVLTLEAGTTDRYHLHQKTLRYTHSKAYVEHVAAIHGLRAAQIEDVSIRHEGDRPVAGYVVVVQKP